MKPQSNFWVRVYNLKEEKNQFKSRATSLQTERNEGNRQQERNQEIMQSRMDESADCEEMAGLNADRMVNYWWRLFAVTPIPRGRPDLSPGKLDRPAGSRRGEWEGWSRRGGVGGVTLTAWPRTSTFFFISAHWTNCFRRDCFSPNASNSQVSLQQAHMNGWNTETAPTDFENWPFKKASKLNLQRLVRLFFLLLKP